MNSTSDQRFFDLAMKVIADRATAQENADLERLISAEPDLRAELEKLRAEARLAKGILSLASAAESTEAELPGYVRERLQTKVRQTLGQPRLIDERKRSWVSRWFLVLAPAAVGLVFFLVFVSLPKQPVIQLAMLDTAGETRGTATNQVTILQEHWKSASVQTFAKAEDLEAWEKDWRTSKRPVAKVIYDPAAAEVRVFVKLGTNLIQRTVAVEKDLSSALRQAEDFIKEQVRR